jgi:protein transport protein SEC61 subunit gamma-like protein|tara:strand:- start:660 stop:851 length:192 start_codon:yes stop_codon:yes gene_type:complete
MSRIGSWVVKLKEFYRECVRVLKVTKKPDKLEFKTIVKASGLGMVILGLTGFIIHMAKVLLFP